MGCGCMQYVDAWIETLGYGVQMHGDPALCMARCRCGGCMETRAFSLHHIARQPHDIALPGVQLVSLHIGWSPSKTRVLGKHIHPAHTFYDIMLQMTQYALNEKHNEYA